MKYCANCGTPHERDTRFCPDCGASLGPAAAALDTGASAPENTASAAAATSASSRGSELGPARAAPCDHDDDVPSASEQTPPILGGSDSVLATPPPAALDVDELRRNLQRDLLAQIRTEWERGG